MFRAGFDPRRAAVAGGGIDLELGGNVTSASSISLHGLTSLRGEGRRSTCRIRKKLRDAAAAGGVPRGRQGQGSGTQVSGLALETAPNRPLPRGRSSAGAAGTSPAPGARQCRSLARARSCVPKPIYLSGCLPEGRTTTFAAARNTAAPARTGAARGSPAPTAALRRRPAAAATKRRRGRAGRRACGSARRSMKGSEVASLEVPGRGWRNIRLQHTGQCLPTQRSCHVSLRDAVHGRPAALSRLDALATPRRA